MELRYILRFTIKAIRQRIKRARQSYSLYIFNARTGNDIQSADVELASIKGSNICVLKGSYISADSQIGGYTYIGFNNLISKAIVGRYCSLASNLNIGHGEHPIDNISTSTLFIDCAYDVLTAEECNIGNDVWIGVSSVIRRGVKIGDGAIIGANSFVNKDVPPFAIVAGSPAQIIKYRFPPEKILQIMQSQWWNHSRDEAKKIIKGLKLDAENN